MLEASLDALLSDPVKYLGGALLILGVLISYVWLVDHALDARAVGWVLYALAISVWEEWVFRLAVPYFAQAQGANLLVAVVLSNLVFGVLHYFTLRW